MRIVEISDKEITSEPIFKLSKSLKFVNVQRLVGETARRNSKPRWILVGLQIRQYKSGAQSFLQQVCNKCSIKVKRKYGKIWKSTSLPDRRRTGP